MKRISYLLLIIALCCTGCTAESSKESLPQVKRQDSSAKAMSTVADTTASKQDTKVAQDSTASVQEEKANNDTVSNDTTSVSESKPVVKEEQPKEKEKNKEGSSLLNLHKISLYVAYALIFVLFVVVYILRRRYRELDEIFNHWQKSVYDLSNRVRELEKKVNVANGNVQGRPLSSNSLSKEVKSPSVVISESNNVDVKSRDGGVKPVANTTSESPKPVVLYLKNFKDGEMRECSKQESQYELHLNNEGDSVGEFFFVGNPEAAVAKKDPTFAGVCDYDNWNTNSKTCHSVEKGRAQKISDGKWEATKKARVKCE